MSITYQQIREALSSLTDEQLSEIEDDIWEIHTERTIKKADNPTRDATYWENLIQQVGDSYPESGMPFDITKEDFKQSSTYPNHDVEPEQDTLGKEFWNPDPELYPGNEAGAFDNLDQEDEHNYDNRLRGDITDY